MLSIEQFSSLQMEVQPLAETEYAELKQLGLDGVMVYQETYHEATYARHHLKGKKQDFFWRLETPDRLGRAGIDKIGLGALIDPAKTARYRKGFRSGQGDALAVVFPGSLLELWRVLKACVTADKIILMQAANTGLTEGSTPNGNDYDRDIVIISTLRLDKLHVLGKGEQVLAYPGTTLYSLEKALKPLGREPHSVIGSIYAMLFRDLTGQRRTSVLGFSGIFQYS